MCESKSMLLFEMIAIRTKYICTEAGFLIP